MKRWLPARPFRPHPLLRSGHVQTIAGVVPIPMFLDTVEHRLGLPDGDACVLHDDRPSSWRPGDPIALLVHGLGGDAGSCYLTRIAAKLVAEGVRSFRIDQRCAGAARLLCQEPYHAGRSGDILHAIETLDRMCPGSRLLLCGFSLGGAICLRLLGERGPALPPNLAVSLMFCPPVDLAANQRWLAQPSMRFYDIMLLRTVMGQFDQLQPYLPRARDLPRGGRPRTMREFDERVVAPFLGYSDAESYYRENSAAPLLHRIARPTVIIAADDDPIIPAHQWQDCRLSACTELVMTRGGGHIGYLGRGGSAVDPDWRWMDWRVVEAARRMKSVRRGC